MENEKVVTPEMIKKAGGILKQEHEERLRLEKVASDYARKERAEKIAFREVELGICEPYKSHLEFQEKVASLLGEDLSVVEKAMERGYNGSRQTGELVGNESTPGKVMNPLERFIMTGELE